ncbi:MAG: GNAT family N-acetyltransferase [Micropruina sp.]|uniref:GNAT family N-acetyltransferase n=1 Tax=Micropruina sp. TaxID=2737536 RepID=UPI0039E56137
MKLTSARGRAGAPVVGRGGSVVVELVSPATVRGLSCPYCGRPMPLDEAGMVAAQAAWGLCGAVATDDERTVGLLLVSAATVGDPQATVALVGALWVAPGHTGQGLGRALVRTAAAGLVRSRVAAMLANSAAPGCAGPPEGFLGGTGFAPMRPRGLWRMDLATTVRPPKRSVLARLGRLVQAVRPVAPPEPARRLRIR